MFTIVPAQNNNQEDPCRSLSIPRHEALVNFGSDYIVFGIF